MNKFSVILVSSLIIVTIVILVMVYKFSIPVLNSEDKIMEESKTLNGKAPSYCNPIIPKGFRISNEGASWKYVEDKIEGWNDGLVIEDIAGNQFVWVPVKDGIENDGQYDNNNEVKYKKWYIREGKDTLDEQTKIEIENLLERSIEGGIVKEEQIVEDKLPEGVISEEEQIIKYGGFYIARYEAGIEKNILQEIYSLDDNYEEITVDKRNNTIEYKPISKENEQIWNFIEYSNAKTVAENMYNNEEVKSGLMTGRQFDTIMRWAMINGYNLEDATTWGNFLDTYSESYRYSYASYLRKHSQDWKLKGYGNKERDNIIFTSSGGLEIAKMNEIYDIAGNVFEFTTDLYEGEISLVRGGCAAYSGKKDSPHPAIATSMGDSLHYVIGFRVVLYIN